MAKVLYKTLQHAVCGTLVEVALAQVNLVAIFCRLLNKQSSHISGYHTEISGYHTEISVYHTEKAYSYHNKQDTYNHGICF